MFQLNKTNPCGYQKELHFNSKITNSSLRYNPYPNSNQEIEKRTILENSTITPEMLSNPILYSGNIRIALINILRLEWWEATGHDCFPPSMVSEIVEVHRITHWINTTYNQCMKELPQMIDYAKHMEALLGL